MILNSCFNAFNFSQHIIFIVPMKSALSASGDHLILQMGLVSKGFFFGPKPNVSSSRLIYHLCLFVTSLFLIWVPFSYFLTYPFLLHYKSNELPSPMASTKEKGLQPTVLLPSHCQRTLDLHHLLACAIHNFL